ncbi:unnamed protein product [Boreogadus saida]
MATETWRSRENRCAEIWTPGGQKSPEVNRRKRFDLCFQLAAGMGALKRRYAVSLAALLICTIRFLLFSCPLDCPAREEPTAQSKYPPNFKSCPHVLVPEKGPGYCERSWFRRKDSRLLEFVLRRKPCLVALSLYTEGSRAVLEGMSECVVQAESRVTGSWTKKVLVLGFFHQLKPCDGLARVVVHWTEYPLTCPR